MKSLFLSCVLFTLADKPCSENKYIPIFNMWLSKLIQNGGLSKEDMLVISIDQRTIEHIKNTPGCLGTLLSKLQCPYSFKIFPAPATLMEGMRIRYHPQQYEKDVYMYLDIDVLVMKSLKMIANQTEPDKIYACAEGKLNDPNYGADMPAMVNQHYIELGGVGLGFTSGIFIITSPTFQDALFHRVAKYYRDAGYYSLDQPFFNRAVHELPHNASLLYKHVSFNGHGYSKDDCVLLNCGGDVANGPIHYDKIVDVISMINAGLF